MSVSCSKDYSLKVSRASQFTHYWPFEVWPGPFQDMVSGHFSMRNNPGIIQGPGLYGFGLRHTNPANATFFVFPTVNTDLAYTPSAATTAGISFCYWINFTTSHNYDVLLFFDLGVNNWTLQQYWTSATKNFTVLVDSTLTPSDSFNVVQDMPNGVWHFVCVTLEKSTNAVSLYVDAALIFSKVMSVVFVDTPEGELRGGTTDPGAEDFTIDEFGLSLNSCFSPATIAWLYNSGAGRTWPQVSGTFPVS